MTGHRCHGYISRVQLHCISQVDPGVSHLVVSHLVVCHLVSVGDRCLSHDLRCSGGVGSDLLWDGVGRSCSIGKSRLSVLLLRVNCRGCSCHHCWGDCLRYWVDVAVLVEVLGEALEVDGGEAARGLDEVSVGRGEWAKLGTLVDKALKGEAEASGEERGEDQLKILVIFFMQKINGWVQRSHHQENNK